MSDPFRLRFLKNFAAALQEIKPANGYVNDVSNAVFRGRDIFGEGDPVPMLCILETPVPPEAMETPEGSGMQASEYDLLIQGFITDDSLNPTDPAHFLMADVKKRLAKERCKKTPEGRPDLNLFDMAGRVTALNYGTGVVRPPDETSAVAYFWLRVTVKILEDNTDPYV